MKTFIAAVVLFGVFIFVHELGHYLLARLSGVQVLEFALGFGPRLLWLERHGTVYSIRAFPLGGFCRMLGEDPEEADQENSFQKASLLQRFAVIAAGPLMNVVLAVAMFSFIYFFLVGAPQMNSTVIGELVEGYPAQAAGLQPGDRIVSIEGKQVNNWREIQEQIRSRPEEEIDLEIVRNHKSFKVSVYTKTTPGSADRGLIGIDPESKLYSPWDSLLLGLKQTWELTRLIAVSLVQMITGEMPADVVGPVGVIQVISQVVETGLSNLLFLGGLISINLAIINILPIPALDGSRLVFLAIEAVRGKPVDPEKEGLIHMVGFAFLITLMLVITYHDLLRLDIF